MSFLRSLRLWGERNPFARFVVVVLFIGLGLLGIILPIVPGLPLLFIALSMMGFSQVEDFYNKYESGINLLAFVLLGFTCLWILGFATGVIPIEVFELSLYDVSKEATLSLIGGV